LLQELKAGMSYVDVGAHYGYFAGLAAAIKGIDSVIAFEPTPTTLKLLRQNLHHTIVDIRGQGLADQSGNLQFYVFPERYSEYNSFDVDQYIKEDWFQQFPPRQVHVLVSTLDKELTRAPDILKIDVEGAEYRVIQGGASILKKKETTLIIEFLAPQRSNSPHLQAAKLLWSWGYISFNLTDQGELEACPNPTQWLAETEQDSMNLVFKPGP
ncbi:MAG: FkbM family methyltransferase, partial [Bacteroidota bacterium]